MVTILHFTVGKNGESQPTFFANSRKATEHMLCFWPQEFSEWMKEIDEDKEPTLERICSGMEMREQIG